MDLPEFSEMLSTRRRQLGYSIAQASRVLRLKEDVLSAFEEGDFDAMPKSGYAQGMLSSYARYLGLDAGRIVELYAEELDAWRRNQSRNPNARRKQTEYGRRSPSVGQPYVPARGLLPTSGGPAGDMGPFATTRVHVRRSEAEDEYDADQDRYGYDEDDRRASYQTNRPYTNRPPEPRARRRSSARTRNDIQMRGVNGREFEDDLRLGRSTHPYEAASTSRGRRSMRESSNSERQRVRRNSNGRSRTSRTGSNGRNSRNRRNSTGLFQSPTQALAVVVVTIIVISVVLVMSISSCINQNFNTTRSVPVSSAQSTENASSKQNSDSSARTDTNSTDSSLGTGGVSESSQGETTQTTKDDKTTTSRASKASVSISVADGAVTWLEIVCDGKSEIAETLTGPWNHTYTVEESLTVQVHNTSAVQVVQDGKQVPFESVDGGIGTIRIQGSKSSNAKKSDAETSTNADKNAESETTEKVSDSSTTSVSERTSTSTSSSGTSSAKMGNNSEDESGSESTGSGKSTGSKSNSSEEYGTDDEY